MVLPARHDEPARPRRHAALSRAPEPCSPGPGRGPGARVFTRMRECDTATVIVARAFCGLMLVSTAGRPG